MGTHHKYGDELKSSPKKVYSITGRRFSNCGGKKRNYLQLELCNQEIDTLSEIPICFKKKKNGVCCVGKTSD